MRTLFISIIWICTISPMSIVQHTDTMYDLGYDNCNMLTNGELKTIQRLIKNDMVIFDIGANKGEWSTHVLKHCPTVSVFCFEPHPTPFKALQKNLAAYQHTEAFNVAISNDIGTHPIYIYNKNSELSSLYYRPIVDTILQELPHTIDVPTQTLDHFCHVHAIQHIDFLKIDTEGSELNVLLGAYSLLHNKQIDTIQFEYGGAYTDAHTTLKKVYTLLKECGYNIYRIAANALLEITSWDDRLENFKYSNYIATQKVLKG